MSTPYTQPTLTGYNSSPPPDDGTQVSTNVGKWADQIIAKVGDPLKTFAQAVDTNTAAAFALTFGHNITSQAGNYTMVAGDRGKFIEFSATATFTLLAVATAGAGFPVTVLNTSSANVTIDGSGAETINGSATLVLGPNEFAILTCNGTLWVAAVGPRILTTQGDVLFHDGTITTRLAAGTSGQFLQTKGAAADPVWATGLITLATEQASTSGTSIDFTSIPAGVKRITIMLFGVSTSGTSPLIVQIGDAGGVETSGYLTDYVQLAAGVTNADSTAAIWAAATDANSVHHGAITLSLEDSTNFTWVASGQVARSDASVLALGAGSKALTAELDRVRITTVAGSDTFDLGAINIQYE